MARPSASWTSSCAVASRCSARAASRSFSATPACRTARGSPRRTGSRPSHPAPGPTQSPGWQRMSGRRCGYPTRWRPRARPACDRGLGRGRGRADAARGTLSTSRSKRSGAPSCSTKVFPGTRAPARLPAPARPLHNFQVVTQQGPTRFVVPVPTATRKKKRGTSAEPNGRWSGTRGRGRCIAGVGFLQFFVSIGSKYRTFDGGRCRCVDTSRRGLCGAD